MTNPNAIAPGPVAAGTPTEGEWHPRAPLVSNHWFVDAVSDARLKTIAKVFDENDAHLMASSKALLAACEMMLANWTNWSDAELSRDAERKHPVGSFAEDCRAVLAMRAAVRRAKGKQP